jgi:hypothetical protein
VPGIAPFRAQCLLRSGRIFIHAMQYRGKEKLLRMFCGRIPSAGRLILITGRTSRLMALNDLLEMGLPSGDERLYFGLFHRPKPVPRALAAGLFDDRPQIPDPVSGPGRAFKIKFAHREKISIKLCENAYAMRPMRDRAGVCRELG